MPIALLADGKASIDKAQALRKKKRRPKKATEDSFGGESFESPQPPALHNGAATDAETQGSSDILTESTTETLRSSPQQQEQEQEQEQQQQQSPASSSQPELTEDALREYATLRLNAASATKWQNDLRQGLKDHKVVFQGKRVRSLSY